MTAVGLDLGGSFLKTVVLDDTDAVVDTRRVEVDDDPLGLVVATCREMVAEHPGAAFGLAVAGLVRDGVLVWAPHVAGVGIEYRVAVEDVVGGAVAVDNDANLAALVEAKIGAGRDADPLLVVALGTGIGAGIVVGGRIYRGRSFAGEVGHVTVVDGGDPCACGRRGCWETLVSGPVLERMARDLVRRHPESAFVRSAGPSPGAAELTAAALLGDPDAEDAVARMGADLGRGLVGLVLTLDPAMIVLAGAVALAGEPLLGPARTALATGLPGSPHRPAPDLVAGTFGPWAGAAGAALAGRLVQNGVHDW